VDGAVKSFVELSQQEILALAISSEEEDSRIYADFAEALRESNPNTAQIFLDMAAEESEHRRSLIELYISKFGGHIPLIRRQDVRGFIQRKRLWQVRMQGIEAVRQQARQMEMDASRFYQHAATITTDVEVRKLLGDLAIAELKHQHAAQEIEQKHLAGGARDKEDENARRNFILQIVQPGLVGLMDGSVSTLAPVFAAAFGTHNSWTAFQVGVAASLGAGISMGFAEALADDGKLSGRGAPYLRGLVCGVMTFAGGIGHTLPYLIPSFYTATTIAAGAVLVELSVISFIQWRYMETPPLSAAAKVMLGGGLVVAAGILIGSS
jgi:erythrin-vacuolar iron transport family protein